MPSRRRPSEPSLRVRALLESADARAGRRQTDRVDTKATDLGATRPDTVQRLLRHGEVVPWLPERSWVEGAASAAPAGPLRRSRLDGRSDALEGQRRSTASAGAAVNARERRPRPAGAPGSGRDARAGRHRRPMPPGPRFLTVPASLRGARLSGPRAAAAGLVLVVLLAAMAFGVRVAWAKAASEPQAVDTSRSGSALADRSTGSVLASSSTASGGGGPPASATVTVHIVGQVRHPGVLVMPAGSRVGDAVAKAVPGKAADLAAINLARPLVDGEQVQVPKPGQVLANGAGAGGVGGGASAGGAGAVGPPGGSGAAGSQPAAGSPVNLNTATVAQLEDLPGVGPVLAQRIVDWRTEHGRFASVDELGEVSGIGEKIFAALQPKVTV